MCRDDSREILDAHLPAATWLDRRSTGVIGSFTGMPNSHNLLDTATSVVVARSGARDAGW